MHQIPIKQLMSEWQTLTQRFPIETASALQNLAVQHAPELADLFYREMLADPISASFLTHDQVKNHLHTSMQHWITTVLSTAALGDIQTITEQQKRIGRVHARIEIPVSLVMRGARLLKGRLIELIEQDAQLSLPTRNNCIRLSSELIDLALEVMCFAFSQSHDRNSRAEEAYRLFSVSQNLSDEKERQRAALLDWENHLMFELALGSDPKNLPPLATSEFGLWFRHKASHAFQGAPENQTILDYIAHIDQNLAQLTQDQPDKTRDLLRQLREQARSIKYLLDSLLDQARELEAGRDVLTRLLNRKFLPVVLGKEVLYSRQSGNSFGLLMIDVDHFKSINDTYGHDAGDLVLQHIAGILSSNIRGGDYTFRLGGEEFLVILVDITPEKAMQVAEKLRNIIANEAFHLPPDKEIALTVSLGVAVYNGHPDYQTLLQRADKALYQAKNSGRNCCILSP
ncbi:diguanylate cyclase [Azomonas agilis]|uniref:Diguanylate cyclase DosC n=1 Tax=Azomonas agilis TaxID=116849 RepID=A0A562I0N3_9GAMM|nr:diguanylate cyclase [Azomonas agilis]TWH64205.1 diguanylate cyclase [Azomonas agilis]